MTTIYEEEVTCAVCGAKQTVQEMGSTSSFGPMDLDTRPPPLQRGTMEMWVHQWASVVSTFRYPLPKTRSEHVPVCSHSVSRLVTVFDIDTGKPTPRARNGMRCPQVQDWSGWVLLAGEQ
jgi:hypothetical protein